MGAGKVKRKSHNQGIVTQIFSFLWEKKNWWLVPVVLLLLLLGLLIIFAQSSPLSPFIYALF